MQLARLIDRVRRDERGFSLITVLMLLVVVSAFSAAAYAASNDDIPASAKNQHRTAAYDAAEAGMNYYLFHLNQDNAYWTHCTNVAAPGGGDPNPVVNEWDGPPSGVADTRIGHWRRLPNGAGSYAIELLHTPGYSACQESDQLSMFDQSTGTFRIRATGDVNGQRRSIIASFRHRGFLDFLYFTNYETIDPVANPGGPNGCNTYKRDGRNSLCPDIVFLDRDNIHGPFHTNDSLVVCGSPTIGRPASQLPAGVAPDNIEISGPAPGYTASGGCTATPNFSKPPTTSAATMAMPPTNSALANVANPNDNGVFTGRTIITLFPGGKMSVNGGAQVNQPANGVIYVNAGAGGCSTSYDGTPDYTDSTSCPIVYVQGTYDKSLTIGSAGDIVVTGNVIRQGNAELGLIPMNFARVFHPVSNCTNLTAGSNFAALPGVTVPAWGGNTTFEVDAAILSLQHSWVVDNWKCGSPLGTLRVVGAVAQQFRGPVGTFSGSNVVSGYLKDYWYDDRLKYVSPPYFLDPVQSSWRVSQLSEQLPAR